MKRILFVLSMLVSVAYGQSIGYFRYDTVVLEKIGGNSELKIKNATKSVTGGVLTNMGNGRTAFVLPSSNSSWNVLGNSGLSASTNFLGTTDNVALIFRTNNEISGRLESSSRTYFGYQAGNGTNSSVGTAIGYQALQNNTGNFNTGIGYTALKANTSGVHNSAVGFSSMVANTTGQLNTALGSNSLKTNTTGSSNVAIGSSALDLNTSGSLNTAIGFDAVGTNTIGDSIVAIGHEAGFNNTTGTGNTYIGTHTGWGITTGKYNTVIGANVIGLSSSLTQNIILADGAGTKRLQFNNVGKATMAAYGSGTHTGTAAYNLQVDASGNIIETTAGSTPTLQQVITAGSTFTGANTYVGGDNQQLWSFNTATTSGTGYFAITSSSLSSGILVDISVNSTAAASNSQTAFNLATFGANATSSQTTIGAAFQNSHSGTGSVNNAVTFSASNGATNNAFNILAGAIALNGSAGTTGQVLTSAGASTLPTWQTPSAGSSGWGLTGNSISGTDFLGTTSNNSLRFRTNNTYRGRWDSTGALIVGASASADANHALIIQQPNDGGADRGIRIYPNNLSTQMDIGYAQITTPSTLFLNSGSGSGIQMNERLSIATSATATSTLHVGGSVATAYVAKTGTYTLTISDYTVEATSGTFTLTLPTSVGITGRIYVITNSGSGVITLGTTSSQTFVNVTATPTTLTLNQFNTVIVQSNGANWLRISSL